MSRYLYISLLLVSGFVLRSQNQDFELSLPGAYASANGVQSWTVESATNGTPGIACTGTLNWAPGSPEFSIVTTPVLSTPWNGINGQFQINNTIIPGSPLGGNNIARLNNSSPGNLATRMRTTFPVTNANPLLQYAYCGSWDGTGHACCDQPFFKIAIYDCQGALLNCTTLSVVPSGTNCVNGSPGYSVTGGVTWRNWDARYVDLTSLIGSCVTVEVINSDCNCGLHHGTAYVDLKSGGFFAPCVCFFDPGGVIITSSYCQGAAQAQMFGPVGYAAYQWYAGNPAAPVPALNGGNTPTLTINSPTAGINYTLQVTTAAGCNYTYAAALQTSSLSIAGLGANASCIGGATGSASVQANGSGTGYTYTWTAPGNPVPIGTASTVASLLPGIYTVAVSSLGSPACGTITGTITVGSIAVNYYTVIKPFCGSIAYLSAPLPGSNFKWYNNNTLIPANQGGSASAYTVNPASNGGVFNLSYTTNQGCKDSIKFLLSQTPPGSMLVSGVSYACQGASNATASINMVPAANAPPGQNSYFVFSTSTPPLVQYTAALNPTALNSYTATGMPAGTYSVVSFDGACTYTNVFTVQEYVFNYQVSPPNSTLCPNTNVLASINFSVPITPNQYNFLWSPATWIFGGQTTANSVLITPNAPLNSTVTTTYSITVTPTVVNCPITKTISITSSSIQPASISTITALCNTSSSLTINALPAGGTFSTGGGSWLSANGAITPSLATIGTNTLAYTISTNTCLTASTASIVVSQFNSAALTTSFISACNIDPCFNLMSFAQSNSGIWSGPGASPLGAICPGALQPGYNVYTYVNPSSPNPQACPDSKTFTVELSLFRSAALTGSVANMCVTSPAMNLMSIVTNSMGAWSGPGVQNNVFNPVLPTGTYTLVYNNTSFPNAASCPASSSIAVYVLNPPTPILTPLTVCNNSAPVQLSVTPAQGAFTSNNYLTAGGLFTPSLGVTGANLVLYINGIPGCSAQSSMNVNIVNAPILSVTGSTLICSGESFILTASGASAYSWSSGHATAAASLTAFQTSTYIVTGTGTNGCISSISRVVMVDACTGMKESGNASSSARLYPNPNSGIATLETELPSDITVFDGLGRVVLKASFTDLKNTIDLSRFPIGVYSVKITDAKKEVLLKLVKTSQ
jgi:hypothetical protein